MAFNIDSFKQQGFVIRGKTRDEKMLGKYEPGERCFVTKYGPLVFKEKYYLFNGVSYEYPRKETIMGDELSG